MLAIILCCSIPLCPQSPRTDPVKLAVTTKTETVTGEVPPTSFKITTSFGSAQVDLSAVTSIRFGSPDVVQCAEVKLTGKVLLESLALKLPGGKRTIARKDMQAIDIIGLARPVPGSITDGVLRNQLSYHLRVPSTWTDKSAWPALLLLHGSNMNAKSYVATVASAWPKLAEEYVLIGVNGEMRVAKSEEDDPKFNYTYVNFVGKSTFKGYPGTDRESPALVAEAITELRSTLKIKRLFVGGHSQGAFLTYSLFMNYPELLEGAFPVSGGVIVQCEPSAYEDAALRARQRKNPLAIVHGKNDSVVNFSMSSYAEEIFEDNGFSALRLFTDTQAAHMFGRLPIEAAVRWLESLCDDNVDSLLIAAGKAMDEAQWRDACELIGRAKALDATGKSRTALAPAETRLREKVAADAKAYAERITKEKDGAWIDSFLTWRREFGSAPDAAPAISAFTALRTEQSKGVTEVVNAAFAAANNKDVEQAKAKWREVATKYFATRWYRMAKRAVQ